MVFLSFASIDTVVLLSLAPLPFPLDDFDLVSKG